ncbi:MAG: carboxypeptidase-like regulatory domain-containing protein [Janthinobacterium lividum]
MKLTATPFNPSTGELLPVYRDAYLRGDLARSSAQAVESYLRHDAAEAHGTVTRWHELQTNEPTAAAPSWVKQRVRFIREQPVRFRRRAGSFIALAALVAGASMASTMHPTVMLPSSTMPSASLEAASLAPEAISAVRTVVVHGRVLNEKGQPLVGATILHKGTSVGTSTDATGSYALRVPAGAAVTLQYGYGGYTEQELPARQAGILTAVALQPRATKAHHWLWF